jgi:23S rRNA (uracil1939-C5)-methyltransferase
MAVGEVVTVVVRALAPGGDAVGIEETGGHQGRATFVPLAAPGERVRVRILRERSRVAFSELVEVLETSAVRVAPACVLFGRCGGCQWQHVDRATQLEAKRAIVARALGLGPGDLTIEAAGPPFGYRARARVAVGRASDGAVVVGFRGRRSHELVDVEACPLLAPSLAAAWPRLRAFATRLPPGSELDVQAGNDGRVQALGAGPAGRERPRWSSDGSDAPLDVGEPGSPPLRVPAGAFAQVGPAGNAALVEAVLAAIGEAPGRVLELYAGSGNFTRHLVGRATAVVAHDGEAAAVARGRSNVPGAAWPSAFPLAEGPAADTVLLDPPRQGLDARHVALVRTMRPRARLVYVSCDPQTLGRDARALRAAGFVLEQARALDLMPQTFHVEVVSRWRKDAVAWPARP